MRSFNNCSFYDETIQFLKNHGKTPDDVLYVGTKKAKISWKDFVELIRHVKYDNGFGCEVISLNLLVVGKDWWLERREYDGSEYWVFNQYPILGSQLLQYKDIFCPDCISDIDT